MRWIEPVDTTALPLLPDLHPLVSKTLVQRGISTSAAASGFLDPGFYDPAPPSALPGMEQAVDRLMTAIREAEPICVWGDFDVDGQTATAVLVSALRGQGVEPGYYLPVRSRESHGVHIPSLKTIIDNGIKLLVTCDTGITSHEAIEYARTRGVDVIITDHHELPPQLPAALTVVNPRMLPPGHPLSTLAGVGVAYKLVEAIRQARHLEPDTALLDLVALGLIADVATLTGDCRYLVQKGLQTLRIINRLGLRAIISLAELNPAHLTEEHIGFALAPRLNALGRLGDANPVVELLTTRDPLRAHLLATQLENYNAQRRLLTGQVINAAEAQLRADPSLLSAPVIIVGNQYWSGGVVGLAASHLVECYGKPAIVFSTPPGELARASARSVDGLDITQAIAAQKDILVTFGGHPMAAGLAVEPENLPVFYRRMQKTVARMVDESHLEAPSLRIDAPLSLPEVTIDLATALTPLAPFGPGNPKLIFACRGLSLSKKVRVGRNQEHAKWTIADDAGNTRSVFWWDGGEESPPEGLFDLACTIHATDWRGEHQVQLELVDFHVVEGKTIEVTSPKVELIDFRRADDKEHLLSKLPSTTLVWAEAEQKDRLGGVDRNLLTVAPALAIWTIPPSAEDLRQAIDIVHPGTIYLFAAHPPPETVEDFLARLSGVLKYATGHRGGMITYAELTTAMAHRLVTVERGVHWLISRGNITLKRQEDDRLWVSPGTTMNDHGDAPQLLAEIQSLLSETAAYRTFFVHADKDFLLS